MSQILSQSEVDALLSAVTEGELQAVDEKVEAVDDVPQQGSGLLAPSDDWKHYDLTSKDRVFRGKFPILELINDKFGRALRTTLNLVLRKVIDIEIENLRFMKYGEFLNSLPLPTCVNIFSMAPLRGSGLFVVESRLVYILIDLFCGGVAVSKYRIEGREFTPIELRLVQRIVHQSLEDLQNAWESVFPLDIELNRTEINPQFVSVAPPDDVVVMVTYNVDVEDSTGKIQVVLPYSALEPIREKLQGGFVRSTEEGDNQWSESIRRGVTNAEVGLSTIFGRSRISIRELLELNEGTVLQLDRYADENVEIRVEGRPKFTGQIGVSRGYRAVQLTENV